MSEGELAGGAVLKIERITAARVDVVIVSSRDVGRSPDVGCIDGLQVGTFTPRDIVVRANDVRSTPFSLLYWRADHAIKCKALRAFYSEEGALVAVKSRRAGKVGSVLSLFLAPIVPRESSGGAPYSYVLELTVEALPFIPFIPSRIPSNTLPWKPRIILPRLPLASPYRHRFSYPHRHTIRWRALRMRIRPPA